MIEIRRPIARLFDGLTDRLVNRMENRAVGSHNRTIVCDFEESDGIGWIAYDYRFLSLRKMHYGMNITKIVYGRSGSGNEKSDGIRANMNRIRLRPSTPMPSNSSKSGNGTLAELLT